MPSHQAFLERTCSYHIQVWSLLIKIAQRLYRLWLVLDFIYENQGTLIANSDIKIGPLATNQFELYTFTEYVRLRLAPSGMI